ncbi:MAG: tetratricopeptide repeat protein [Chloracidobacterium sp.]|nr:tetratricopeptide repeat protein [Chloracidobacterium sp.]
MREKNFILGAVSYLLILLLLTQANLQIVRAGHPDPVRKELNDEKTENEIFSEADPVVQQGVLDGATKNFLKGLSGTRFEVAMTIVQTVERTGGKVVAVGSWISGKGYADPILGGTSDHDLRVIFEGSEPLAKAKYNQVRREIIDQINKRFGRDASRVLRTVNLYPPEVFLEGIDDAEKAIQKLMQEGIDPNLGDAITDGLWGKGAKAFRDAYEAKAGRVIWKEGNTIRSGFADLLPTFGEKAGIYTIEGAGNTARQVADKIDDALRAGDARVFQKQLGRLRDTLKKGRDLSKVSQASYLDDLVKHLDDCCKGDLKKLAAEVNNPAFRLNLAGGLRRARFEAGLLLHYAAETNPQNIQIIREMLQGTKWARVSEAFMNYAGKVAEIGGKLRLDLALKGFFAVLIAYQVYDYYKKFTQADIEGILKNALLDATFLVSPAFVIGFVPLILKAIMDDAVDYGYALITAQQDCQDLIAGIYEVKGRESLDVNQRAERSVDQLATEYTEESKVLAIVALHARNATIRNGKEDPKAEKMLYDRCSKEIVDRWRWRRIELIGDAVEILKRIESDFNAANLIGTATPEEFWILPGATGTVSVNAAFEGDTAGIRQKLADLEKKLKPLGGKENLVGISIDQRYRWMPYNLTDEVLTSPDGPIFDAQKASRQFTFEGENIENLRLEYEFEIKIQTVVDDVLSVQQELERTFVKTTSFNIRVNKPTGVVEIIAPSRTEAEMTCTLTASLDENLRKLPEYSLVWHDLTEGTAPHSGNSYSFTPKDAGDRSVLLEVYAKLNGVVTKVAQAEKMISIKPKVSEPKPTASPSPVTEPETPPSKLMFGGIASDIWETFIDEKGFRMKRQTAKSKGTGECKWEAWVDAEIWGRFDPSFAPETPAEIAAEIKSFTDLSEAWGKKAETRAYAIGDFKGQFADTSVRFRGGGWAPDAGYRGDSISAEGRGWLILGRRAIEVGYNIGGGGCWENSDQAFLEIQANAAQAEAKAIVNSLTLTGLFSKTAYKGPKLDGSDMPRVVLSPAVLGKVKVGETVNVHVRVENAKADDGPFQYNWLGEFDGKPETSKDKTSVVIRPTKPGQQTLSVSVGGSKFFVGSASLTYEVAALKAEIKQTSPLTGKVLVGVPVSFSAELLSEGSPVKGNYIYRFQPSPAVTFDVNESAQKQTKATFSRPGVEKIWVQVLERRGDVLETVAESEQIEIEIAVPELAINFDQEKPLVGKPVKARVETVPGDLKEIDFRWEISANAKLTLESPDSKEITFVPQDGKPVTVKVSARVPVTGDDLGMKEATIMVQSFDVRVDVLGTRGEKPKVWKEGVGLVPLDSGIAVFQNVGLKALVTPAADDLRYRWTLNEDSHFVGGNSSSEITVNRSQTGTCEASVVITNKDGVELGRGSGTFNVSVSQNELDNASRSAESAKKLSEAKGLIGRGLLDQAIAVLDEAVKLDPQNAEAAALLSKTKNDSATIKRLMPLIKQTAENASAGKGEVENAIRNVDQILEIQPGNIDAQRYRTTLTERLKRADNTAIVSQAIKNGETLHTQRKYGEAIREFDRAIGLEPANVEALRLRGRSKRENGDLKGALADLNKALEIEPNNSRALLGRGLTREKLGDTKGALDDYNRGISLEPTNPSGYSYRGRLKIDLKDHKGAIADLDRLISLDPKNVSGFVNRGLAKDRSGDPKAAIIDYNEAIKLDPNHSLSYNNRGSSKEKLGDLKGALADYERAVQLDPSSELAKKNLARLKAKMEGEEIPPEKKGETGFLDISGTRWNWYDPNADATYSIEGDSIVIRAPKGNDLWVPTNFDAPRLTKQVTGDFVLQARLQGNWRENYNGSGLVVHAGRSSVIRLDRGIYGAPTSDNHVAIFGFSNGRETGRGHLVLQNTDLYLRLVRKGSEFTGFASTDGINWQKVGTVTASFPSTVDAGLVLINEYNSSIFQTRFSEFKLMKATDEISPKGVEKEVLSVGNIDSVSNGPTAPTTFTVPGPYRVTFIQTYHWNNGRGARPGTIGLRSADGKVFGPWPVSTKLGQGGVPNAYWEVSPNIVIPAGTYTIVDSEPATWSQNARSGGRGMAVIKGIPVSGTTETPVERMRITVTYVNSSKQDIHMFATGENFSPENRLVPGGSRRASGEGPKFSQITVIAGVNGKVVDRLTFDVTPDAKYQVTFGSNNKLTFKRL